MSENIKAKIHRRLRIKGKAVTGTNRLLDQPVRDYGTILGAPLGTMGFFSLAEHNPEGDEPIPLTSATSDGAVLATNLDPNLAAFLGIDPATFDKSRLNVPLQEVKTLVGQDGVTRESLPGILNSEPFAPSIAAPHQPITLKSWLKGRGRAVIRCRSNGRNILRIKVRRLVPHRLYTVWGSAVAADKGLFPFPLGGAPPAFFTDDEGCATFERELNFCPLEESSEIVLAWFNVVLHSDHMVYGAIPGPSQQGYFGGIVAHVHLEFYLLGQPA